MVIARAWGEQGMVRWCLMGSQFVWEDEEVLEMDADGCPAV